MAAYALWVTFGNLPATIRIQYNKELERNRGIPLSSTDRVWAEYSTALKDGTISLCKDRHGLRLLTVTASESKGDGEANKVWKLVGNLVKEILGLKESRAATKTKVTKYYKGAIPVVVIRQGSQNSTVEFEREGQVKRCKVKNEMLHDTPTTTQKETQGTS